jgi:hypothetical protein
VAEGIAGPEPVTTEEPVPPPAQEPVPPPPSERRTIQIGQRPGPLPRSPMVDEGGRGAGEAWTPRLIAVVGLLALVVVVLLLVLLAF